MANIRSPKYPNIDVQSAIQKVRSLYEREQRQPVHPEVAVTHMGFTSLNGASLKTLSSLRKYGLIEGRGDEFRVSKDAQTLVLDEPNSLEYKAALGRCALRPALFAELAKRFEGTPSERNVAVYLEKQGFKASAATMAAKNYLRSVALVSDVGGVVDGSPDEGDEPDEHQVRPGKQNPKMGTPATESSYTPQPGIVRAALPTDEGEVALLLPANLSNDTLQDVKDWLKLVLRRLERKASVSGGFSAPPPTEDIDDEEE